MTVRYREVVPEDGSVFTTRLESEAVFIGSASKDERDYARSVVAEQIAALLEQAGNLRRDHSHERELLVSLECEVGPDLLGTESRRWWYSDHRMEVWRDRQRLLVRRGSLQLERVRADSAYRERLRQLHGQLLILVQRHRALR